MSCTTDNEEYRKAEAKENSVESIYNSEAYARAYAAGREIDYVGLSWNDLIDAIEEWEEEFC